MDNFESAVQRIKELADAGDKSYFEMGDLALKVCPMGDGHAHNGSEEELRALALRSGVSYDRLESYRKVAARFAEGLRNPSVRWSVYHEMYGLPEDEREVLLKKFQTESASTASGRWTVAAVRSIMSNRHAPMISGMATLRNAAPEYRAKVVAELLQQSEVKEVLASSLVGKIGKEANERTEERVAQFNKTDQFVRELDKQTALSNLNKLILDFNVKVEVLLANVGSLGGSGVEGLFLTMGVNRLKENTERIEVFITTGKTDLDAFVEGVLKEGK